MHFKQTRTVLALALVWVLVPASVHADGVRPHAVASFSILADLVQEIGGDRISVHPLVGAGADTHVFRPSPRDASQVATADIVFINGLGFEGWIERLVAASGYAGPVVVASRGVPTIEAPGHGHHHHGHDDAEAAHDGEHHDGNHADGDERDHRAHEDHDEHAHEAHAHDDHEEHEAQDEHAHAGHHREDEAAGNVDPHVWHSLTRSRLYATNIAAALIALDIRGAEIYAANLARLLASIAAVEREFRAAFANLSPRQRVLVTSHDAFGYLADDFDLEVFAPVGLSTEAEASPADVVEIIHQIRERNVPAVFPDNITDPRLLQQITRETGVRIGGNLYSDALSGPDGPASSYLKMMQHNLRTILIALSGTG